MSQEISKIGEFPNEDDWDMLLAESDSDSLNPLGLPRYDSAKFGPAPEPDWESLLDDWYI